MRQRVVVIGQGYTSRLCVIRSVAQLGCEVYVIVMTGYLKDGKTLNTRQPIDCYSKYVDKVLYCQSNDVNGLMALLLTECIKEKQKPVLISIGDFVTTVIDSHLNVLRQHFLFSHICHQQGAIVEWMNKEKQKALAQKVGLNIVNSRSFELRNGNYLLPSDISYPCFTKTRAYLPGCKKTLKRCNNESELKEFIGELGNEFDLTLLVEDYKEIETEYAVVGFSDGVHVVIPGIIRILSLAHGNHFGVACRGEAFSIKGFEELVSKFKQFVLETGYVGIFDIDFYQSEGLFYFGELNLRMGGSGYIITKLGVNLPAMLVNSLLGKSNDAMAKEISERATFVNERMWIGDWQGNYISTKKFLDGLRTSDVSFVSDKDDNAPKRALNKILWVMFAKKILKRLIR